jgi:hypothetical protein
MTGMIRKQVYIRPDQEVLLKRRARELGVTEAELIRRGIDQTSDVSANIASDHAAWEEELAFIRERARLLPGLAQTRTWTRAELYEE